VRRVLQLGLKGEQRLAVVRGAGLELAVARHQVVGQVLQPLHVERPQVKAGAAVDAHAEPGLRGLGVDLGTARHDAGGCVAAAVDGVEQALFRAVPRRLAEGLAHRQAPGRTQQVEVFATTLARLGELALELDIHRRDLGTFAGFHLEHPAPRVAAVETDPRRKITLGREQIGHLAARPAHHRGTVGTLLRQHDRRTLEQADVLLEHCAHRVGRLEADVQRRLLCRILRPGRTRDQRQRDGAGRQPCARGHCHKHRHADQAPWWYELTRSTSFFEPRITGTR